MEGTQQQTTIAPVVRHSCSCPRRSKNRLSATQVLTQEGGGREEFHSDATLTQLVQGAKAARVRSINPWVPKLTRKPAKVTTTKKVRDKEVELTSYVFDIVYRQELIPSAMLEKVKPVLDTSYLPYVSDGNQEENKEPEFYKTNEGQLVLKKVAAFYTKVPMPCVVPNANEPIPTAKKPAHKRICCVWLQGTTSWRTRREIFITKDLRFKASLGLAFKAKLRTHILISWKTRCKSPFGRKDRNSLKIINANANVDKLDSIRKSDSTLNSRKGTVITH
ncbi:hypothetical protein DSO57_1032927 [Entomophthora muscae]|uniref:Uncharacterized protein n=1 Tax=Entomophthora muscae TaxID=34485 RepID=A0ACC2TB57_9FUNG|nr:hypothetical protein DSO57_1032927 [Entomophthora muscae]